MDYFSKNASSIKIPLHPYRLIRDLAQECKALYLNFLNTY